MTDPRDPRRRAPPRRVAAHAREPARQGRAARRPRRRSFRMLPHVPRRQDRRPLDHRRRASGRLSRGRGAGRLPAAPQAHHRHRRRGAQPARLLDRHRPRPADRRAGAAGDGRRAGQRAHARHAARAVRRRRHPAGDLRPPAAAVHPERAGRRSSTASRPTRSGSIRPPSAASRRTAPTPARSCSPSASAAQSLTLVKDVDGLYDRDPKRHPDASFIREIGVAELRERNLPTLPSSACCSTCSRTRGCSHSFQIVNGRRPGTISAALAASTSARSFVNVDAGPRRAIRVRPRPRPRRAQARAAGQPVSRRRWTS